VLHEAFDKIGRRELLDSELGRLFRWGHGATGRVLAITGSECTKGINRVLPAVGNCTQNSSSSLRMSRKDTFVVILGR
jgi:hypothetical protein